LAFIPAPVKLFWRGLLDRATDIANGDSEAEVSTAVTALRTFNIFHSPHHVIVARGRDRAAVSIISGF
jgi:hypothetical protein